MTRFSVGEVGVSSKKRKHTNREGTKVINRNHLESLKKILEEVEEEEEEEEQDDPLGERDEEMEGGVGGGGGGDDQVEGGEVEESSGSGLENSSSVSVRIDPDVLDCSVCFEPLCPPLFQCQNGHVACSSCHTVLSNKCHICACTIGYSRCLALEKVIESVTIRCSHAIYGCKRTFSYLQRRAHEDACIYAPCHCPIADCSFRGSTRMLLSHFTRVHHHSAKSFRYAETFGVVIIGTDPYELLQGDDDHLFLIINNDDEPLGRTLSVACVQPGTMAWDFTYELTARNRGSFLQLRAPTTNIKSLIGYHPPKVFLMVPVDCYSSGKIALEVCIRKE